MQVIGESADGTTIALRVGDVLELRLPENASTGYRWQVRENAAPYPVRWPSPTLGDYNRTVLGELLGLSDAEIDQLARAGVIGDQLVVAGEAERGAA